jgi:hypothetical protein
MLTFILPVFLIIALWLEDRVQPNRSVLQGKYCRIN